MSFVVVLLVQVEAGLVEGRQSEIWESTNVIVFWNEGCRSRVMREIVAFGLLSGCDFASVCESGCRCLSGGSRDYDWAGGMSSVRRRSRCWRCGDV